MEVSPSLSVPPIKIVIAHQAVLSECWGILFGLRYDMVDFWWLFMELFWVCSGPFGIVWRGSI